MENLSRQGEDFNQTLNKTLHTMAAHLHRYGSELGTIADIVDHVEKRFEETTVLASSSEDDALNDTGDIIPRRGRQRTRSPIDQVRSQLKDIDTFRQELERKTQNILALVSLEPLLLLP